MDAEERDALARLGPELGVLRTRHAQDPAVELLRAARAGVLPEDVQARADRYLAESRWSRTLLEGLEDVGEDAQLDGQQAARLLSRIARDARGRRRFRGVWLWPVFATAAATIAAAVLVIPGGPREDSVPERSQSEPPPQAQPQSGRTASTPTYRLPLDKPPVKISAAALTWRGSESSGDLLSDLKPALEAFRADRYESAALRRVDGSLFLSRRLETLSERLPRRRRELHARRQHWRSRVRG
jgi:hypothetical protein